MSKKKHKKPPSIEKSIENTYKENCKYLKDNITLAGEDPIQNILFGLGVAETEGLMSYQTMNETVEYLIQTLIKGKLNEH